MTYLHATHLRRLRRTLLCAACLALVPAALAQIGGDPDTLSDLAGLETEALEAGTFRTPAGLVVEPVPRNGALYAVRMQSEAFDDAAALEVAALVGAATGFGAGIEQPVLDFLAQAVPELAGEGPSVVGIERFRLTLDVNGADAPFDVTFALALAELPEEAFPETRHAKGPADAPIVIREFSDFSCPACRRFVLDVLPRLEATLLPRGDVRIEYHHFPLIGSFPHSLRAAEVAECVTDANPEDDDAFWRYHDALFERQAEWSRIADADAVLLAIAEDVGVSLEGVDACLAEERHVGALEGAYQQALSLQLRGTPSVFVGGYRLENFGDLGAYHQAIAYIEAFGPLAESTDAAD